MYVCMFVCMYISMCIFIFIFILEKERMQVRQRQREGDRGSKAGSVLTQQVQCGARTCELRDHDLSLSWTLNQLSHPGAPIYHFF